MRVFIVERNGGHKRDCEIFLLEHEESVNTKMEYGRFSYAVKEVHPRRANRVKQTQFQGKPGSASYRGKLAN